MKELLMLAFIVLFIIAAAGVEKAVYCAAEIPGACDEAVKMYGPKP